MKYLILILLISGCSSQTVSDSKILYNEDFKWTIVIPDEFNSVSLSDWSEMQNKGADAIEDTFGGKIINRSNLIFVFKNAEYNYLESNYQLFDKEIDGGYQESFENVNAILYETFRTQIPGAEIVTSSSVEIISDLEFQTHTMKINLPNGLIMNMIIYSRLFGANDFTVNIVYVDESQGKKMLNAWKNSKFE